MHVYIDCVINSLKLLKKFKLTNNRKNMQFVRMESDFVHNKKGSSIQKSPIQGTDIKYTKQIPVHQAFNKRQ